MSFDLTAEQQAAATRMYVSGTALKDLILKNGEAGGLEEKTIMNVAVDFQTFVHDLNIVTGMKFEEPVGFSEDRTFKAGSLVAAIEQMKKSIQAKVKEEINSISICVPTYKLRNILIGQEFTIFLEVYAANGQYVLGMNDQGQAAMSQRHYWEAPRAVTPTPTQAPTEPESEQE